MAEIKKWVAFLLLGVVVAAVMGGCAQKSPTTPTPTTPPSEEPQKTKVTLTAYFAAPKDRWEALVKAAEEKFEEEHPNIDLEIKYMVYPYGEMHKKLVTMAAANAEADIVSIDQIWLGEFVEAGYIKDISNEAKAWGIEDKLYAPYVKGCMYDGNYYAVWAWTDARLMWYRKDILEKANVEPGDLKTWEGFLKAVPKIKDVAEAEGMGGVAFPGAPWLVDWWYPYLFENGGKILVKTNGGYKAGFDNEAGIKAANYLLEMKKAGVEFPTVWKWGEEFAGGRYVVWFGGTWVLGKFSEEEQANISEKIGVMMFPAPSGKESRTLSGGWLLAIPSTSKHPDIAWEFIKCMLDPDVLTPVLAEYSYLPTQKVIAEDSAYASQLEEEIPFWPVFREALTKGAARPNMPEYPKVAEILYEELSKVVYEKTTPEDAVHTAAEKVNALWQG